MNNLANPEMLLLARESRGITQSQLAEKINVSQAAISKAEKFSNKISEQLLSDISRELKYPISFFYQNGKRFSTTNPFHRKKQSIPQKTLDKIEAIANIKRIHIEKLLESIEIESTSIPYVDKDEYSSIEDIALHVRQLLRLPRGPIENITSIIENFGIPVILCDFYTDKIDGFTISNILTNIIFVNINMPWCRIRFTLAHELGHIILNHTPELGIEDEANQFASSFLMPKNDIYKDFLGERITLERIASLKPYWKVSMQSLIYRAKSLNLIDDKIYQNLWITLNKLGYKKREPVNLNIKNENPTLFKTLIDIHKNDLKYSTNELFEFLNIYEQDFNEMYPEMNNKEKKISLKLVK